MMGEFMESDYLTDLKLGDYKKVNSAKVREIFDIGEYLLLVATDRISAFDVVLPDAIPKKGGGIDPDVKILV